jgi:hypothetical protein
VKLSVGRDLDGKNKKVDIDANTDVATSVIYGLSSFLSCSTFICNPKHAIREFEGPLQLLPPLEGEHLERTNRLALISP